MTTFKIWKQYYSIKIACSEKSKQVKFKEYLIKMLKFEKQKLKN